MHRIYVMFFILIIPFNSLYGESEGVKKYHFNALYETHYILLNKMIGNESILNYMLAKNVSHQSLDEIILKDNLWPKSKKLQKEITGNVIAKKFRQWTEDKNYRFSEIMLTNKQGALLAAYPVTSDYWQGDENKFIYPVRRKKNYISEIVWDESSRSYSFFISLPVYQKQGFLGVLIAGIDISEEYFLEMGIDDLMNLNINGEPVKNDMNCDCSEK